MGDDLPDIPLARRAGLAVCVADGAPELAAICHFTTRRLAGHGTAREVVELILKAQGRWEEAVPVRSPKVWPEFKSSSSWLAAESTKLVQIVSNALNFLQDKGRQHQQPQVPLFKRMEFHATTVYPLTASATTGIQCEHVIILQHVHPGWGFAWL
jgi:hypothetical protein